jgi:hydrophobe/amphiphile efflux-3 (HAE3) family protein
MIEDQVEQVSELIERHPERIIAGFLALTLVFSLGLSNISTTSGTSDFTEGIEAMEALNDIQAEFGPAFPQSSSSTQLILERQNALSKKSLLKMLRTEKKLLDSGIPVESATSPADMVASGLDPNASSKEDRIRALESATPSRIDTVVGEMAGNSGFTGMVSNDFNREDASASMIMGSLQHSFGGGSAAGPPGGGSGQLEEVQGRIDDSTEDIIVFGSGITSMENSAVIGDSLLIVVPAASLFIVFFLIYAYRDPFDLFLGVLSLVIAIVWTFGFMGLVGIPFSQMLIAVPPLLLAVGIDFGIHSVNRYKEEREHSEPGEAMKVGMRQLLVAFFMVAGTTVIGFLSNLTSSLPPIQDFGIVAGIGITFTTLIFGLFLPAGKLYGDRFRMRHNIPILGQKPVGAEGSILGKVLPATAVLGRVPFVAVIFFVILGGFSAFYGSGVDTSFSQEDFLPPEDIPAYLENLPEPFAPGDYSATEVTNLIDENFAGQDSVTVYIEAPMREPAVLESIQRRSESIPSSFSTSEGSADYESLFDVMDSTAQRSPEFRQVLENSDVDGDGVPERNVEQVYDTLMRVSGGSAGQYLSSDYRSTQLRYTVDSDASQAEIDSDARDFASDFRYSATATGTIIVFKAVSDLIFDSAINALAISLLVSTVFLIAMYQLVFEKPLLAVANMFPVALTLAFILATMRFLEIPLNALTATVLSITIGLGVDYSVHVVDRFEDELVHGDTVFEALEVTLRGTGGALTSSMLTTVSGIGVLMLAITPVLGQFGLITSLSIFYSYISSLVILPPALVVWYRLRA